MAKGDQPVQMDGKKDETKKEPTPSADAKKEATPAPEAKKEKDATPSPEAKKEAPPPPAPPARGAMEADAARDLLQKSFGTYRQISAGDVRVLAQADFQAAYDAVYGATQYAWALYVAPGPGNLEGFAHNGVNYINRDVAEVATVPHEMLHSNAAADWRPVTAGPFDEGATEYLERYALAKGGLSPRGAPYANERSVVEAYLASGKSESELFTAYLKGGAENIVRAHVDASCKKTFDEVKAAMGKGDWAAARTGLQRK